MSRLINNTMRIKQVNVDIIKEVVRAQRGVTKQNISQITSLSISTCDKILNE